MKKIKSEIILKSNNKSIILLFALFFKKLLIKNGISFRVITFPIKKKLITFNKSPHVYKKALEHFELLTFKILFTNMNNSLIRIISYTKINKPKGLKIYFKFYE